MYLDEIAVGRAENLIGKKFGYLTVKYRTLPPEGVSNKGAYWKCECDCGGIISVRADSLKKGYTKSCGCSSASLKLEKKQIELNDIFGDLTVIKKLNEVSSTGHSLYLCECKCGNLHIARSCDLQTNKTTSCGCKSTGRIDLKNKRVGNLTVLEPTDKTDLKSGSIIWKCICDCGKECFYSASALNNYNVKSCGCENRSKGQIAIINLLKSHNIDYEEEKRFDTCRFIKYPLPFDIYVNNLYLIEFDGEQHFKSITAWGGEDKLRIQQERDAYKNQWCKDNNIPLIRIPYTKLNTLSIEDLMLETTTFRVI